MKGIICKKYSVGYFPIPKVANTSIKHAIYQIEFDELFSPQKYLYKYNRNSLLAKIYKKSDDDLPRYKHIHDFYRNKMKDITSEKFRFTIIRDPIKRFLSAYSNRVLHHKELSIDKINLLSLNQKEHIDFNHFIYEPDLSQFINFLDIYIKVPSINIHIRPISNLICNLDFFSKVYPIESIDLLETDLSTIISKKINIRHSQTGGKKIHVSMLGKEHIFKLLDFYKEDYFLLSKFYSAESIYEEWNKSQIYNGS